MFRRLPGLAVGLLLVAAPLQAQQNPASGPGASPPVEDAVTDGKTLYRQKTCVACHGRDGGRAIQNYPELAGQELKYLQLQLEDITTGKRISGLDARGYPRTQGMKDIMHLISADQRKAVAEFLAALPAPKPRPLDPAPDAARLAAGKSEFLKGGCVTCHGPDGAKPIAANPYLAGMKRDYLVLQMTEIRDGVRKSPRLAAMMPFAKKLDETKISLIADYLSQIERPAK